MSVRGRKAHELLLWEEPPAENADEREQRGRSQEKILARNEHLLARFVWYGMDKSRRYEWIVERLADEFYLTESTVGQLIEASAVELRRLRNGGVQVSSFKEKWPHFKW